MGRNSADYKRAIRAAGARGGRRADHSSPIRNVLGTVEVPSPINAGVLLEKELLECGHLHSAAFKPYARRRRCRKCAAGRPQDVDPNDYEVVG